jgi:hypothetical protein
VHNVKIELLKGGKEIMDGTDGQRGTLPGGTRGQFSEAKTQGTSKDQPKTYTDEEVTKRISDELAAKGRDAKSLETKAAQLKQLGDSVEAEKAKIAKWQEEREQEEIEAAKDSPDALTLIQRKQTLRKKEAEFAEKQAAFDTAKAEHDAELQDARDVKREITIWQIAGEDIDPRKLKDACDKLNAQTEEQIKAIADNIRPEKKTEETPKFRFGTKAPVSVKADSSVTTGVVPGDSPREKVTRGLDKLRKQ